MKWGLRIAATAAVSAGLALMLSTLPEWERPAEHVHLSSDRTIEFSDTNLVDTLADLPLRTELRRVDWRSPILMVDLKLPGGVSEADLFADLYEICRFAFADTSNIGEVMIRVKAAVSSDSRSDARKEALLLSLEADRMSWDAALRGTEPDSPLASRLLLNDIGRFRYTDAWREIRFSDM